MDASFTTTTSNPSPVSSFDISVPARADAVPFKTWIVIPSVISLTSGSEPGSEAESGSNGSSSFGSSLGEGDALFLGVGVSLSSEDGVSAADATLGGFSALSPPRASTANQTPVAKTAATRNHGSAQPTTDR